MYSHLLAEYADSKDMKLRNKLIELHLPLVKTVAKTMYNRQMRPDYEYTDIVHFGIFGLINAIEKFDKNKAPRFSTYAWIKIHGAIIDELRKLDFVPRSTRAKIRKMKQWVEDLGEDPDKPSVVYKAAKEYGLKTRDIDIFFGEPFVSLEEVAGLY